MASTARQVCHNQGVAGILPDIKLHCLISALPGFVVLYNVAPADSKGMYTLR